MKIFSLLRLFILSTCLSTAQAVEIGDKDWRQLTDTVGITYDELASIYDVSTGRLLDESRHMIGDVDFSGWTWAAAQDVYAMYAIITGKPLESYDYYYEENPPWLFPFFNTLFEYTDQTNLETVIASGIGRDGVYDHKVIAMKIWISIEDSAAYKYFGGVETRGVSRDGSSIESEPRYGAHMYRTISAERSQKQPDDLLESPLTFSVR